MERTAATKTDSSHSPAVDDIARQKQKDKGNPITSLATSTLRVDISDISSDPLAMYLHGLGSETDNIAKLNLDRGTCLR